MEENKKNNVILSILCLILAFACMVALLSVGEDDNKSDNKNDNKNSNSSTDSSDSSESTDSEDTSTDTDNSSGTQTASFYLDGDLGYRVIGNQTVFFLVCENPSWYTTAANYYKNSWYIHIDPKDCVSYEGLTVDIRYSKNKGVTWSALTKVADDSTEGDGTNIYALYNIGADETVYLSYAFVSNCADPVSVLSDLKENIFNDKVANKYTGTDYSYTEEHYEDFPAFRYNYKRDDVIIPSG